MSLRKAGLAALCLVGCNTLPVPDGGSHDSGAATGMDAGALPDAGMAPDGGTPADGGGDGDGGVTQTLGMNDVTVLVPIDAGTVLFKATDLATDGTPLIPANLFSQVTFDTDLQASDIGETLDQFQITAVRFDACDRVVPGPCAAGADGRLRLVLQPLTGALFSAGAGDMGLHAFYVIQAVEMPAVVAALRQLATLQGAPLNSPLQVSPALSANPSGAYATQLRQLIADHAGTNHLMRLTFFGQPEISQAIEWAARGVELQGSTFAAISISGIDAGTQRFVLGGGTTYMPTPVADIPTGFVTAISDNAFAAATPSQQADVFQALAAIENPLSNTPATVQCMGCHTSTLLTAAHAQDAGINPLTVPGRYTSSQNLSTAAGQSTQSPLFVRGLGWRGMSPLISQRAANETAQALTELEARYPPP